MMKIATAKAMATAVNITRAANSRERELGCRKALPEIIAPASPATDSGLSTVSRSGCRAQRGGSAQFLDRISNGRQAVCRPCVYKRDHETGAYKKGHQSMTSIEHHLEDNHLCRYAPALRYYESPSPQPPVLHDSIARLRAFSMLLCMDADLADELVEVTLLRSSVGADPAAFGPNLSTWLVNRR